MESVAGADCRAVHRISRTIYSLFQCHCGNLLLAEKAKRDGVIDMTDMTDMTDSRVSSTSCEYYKNPERKRHSTCRPRNITMTCLLTYLLLCTPYGSNIATVSTKTAACDHVMQAVYAGHFPIMSLE